MRAGSHDLRRRPLFQCRPASHQHQNRKTATRAPGTLPGLLPSQPRRMLRPPAPGLPGLHWVPRRACGHQVVSRFGVAAAAAAAVVCVFVCLCVCVFVCHCALSGWGSEGRCSPAHPPDCLPAYLPHRRFRFAHHIARSEVELHHSWQQRERGRAGRRRRSRQRWQQQLRREEEDEQQWQEEASEDGRNRGRHRRFRGIGRRHRRQRSTCSCPQHRKAVGVVWEEVH